MSTNEREGDGQAAVSDSEKEIDADVEEDEEEGEEESEGDAEVDAELLELRSELIQLEKKEQEEKALTEKIESERRLAQEQKASLDEQIAEKKKELAQLEKESGDLMVEGRMYQLASREYDLPLKDTWSDKPEQALVVDLSRMVRMLEQSIRRLNVKRTPTGNAEVARAGELEVIHLRSDDSEVSRTNIPYKANSTVGEVFSAACAYWSLDPTTCEIENQQGQKLVRKDALPSSTTQLVLKDRPNDDDDVSSDVGSQSITQNRPGEEGSGDDGGIPIDGTEADRIMDGGNNMSESVQVGKDSITKRDARLCHHLELLLVVLLATVFVAMSLEFRNVPLAFAARSRIKQAFAEQLLYENSSSLVNTAFSFEDVTSENRMWQWIGRTASIYAAAPLFSTNCSTSNVSFLLTQVTISQLRTSANSTCNVVSVAGSSPPCYGPFRSSQSVVPFANVVTDPLVQSAFVFNATAATRLTSACSSWPALVTDTFPGLYAYYPERQLNYYALDLDQTLASQQISLLETNGWIDASTRLVAVTFTAFQQSAGVFVNVLAIFEYLPNGAVVPKWISIPFFAQVNDDSFDLAFLILSLVLVGSNFLFVVLSGMRNYPLLMFDFVLIVFVILYYVGNLEMSHWISDCQTTLENASPGQTFYVDFTGLAFQNQLVSNFIGVIVVLFAFRLYRFLDSSPSTSRIFRAMSKGVFQYFSLFFIVAVLACCFAFMAYFIFGRQFRDFYVPDLAFASLWISYTIANSGAYVGVSNWGAVVLSIVTYIFMFLIVYFVCFAVSAAAYIGVSDEIRKRGYWWMDSTRAASRYVDAVVAPSGSVRGKRAQKRMTEFQASKRTYGDDS